MSLDGGFHEIKSKTKHVGFSWEQALDAGSIPAISILRVNQAGSNRLFLRLKLRF